MHQKGHTLSQPKGNIVLVSLIVLLVLVGTVLFFISKGIIKNPLQKSSPNSSLGSQIFEKTKNPISGKIPETNPLGAAKINPFKNIYPNPFDRISK